MQDFSSLLPEAIFEAAEHLGGRCTGRFLALNAMENRVYDIEYENGTHCVIKFYRPGRWSRETILSEHQFLCALHAEEVPVVAPLQDGNGNSLFEKNGLFFAIFPKRPGRLEPELNREQLIRVGRYLARIHNVGARMKGVARQKLNPQTYGRDCLVYLQQNGAIPKNLGERYKTIVFSICDRIENYFERFEPILLHGDCHAGNILWQGENPYFIDFDDMLYAPPVQDIWMVTGSDDEYGKEMRNILLGAYESMRSFDEESLLLIEPLRALRMIYFSAWIAKRWGDGAFKAAFPTFDTERYWQEQVEALSNQLEKLP